MHRRVVIALLAVVILAPALASAPEARAGTGRAGRGQGTTMTLTFESVPGGKAAQKTFAMPMPVLAWSWGAARGGATGPAATQDVSLTKYSGLESPALFALVANGGTIGKATLTLETDDLTTITMYDVHVSSMSTGGSGGEQRFTENISIAFRSYELVTQSTDANGVKQTRSSGRIRVPQAPQP